MLIKIQNGKSIREVDIINVDVENPDLKDTVQPYVLVGFNLALNDAVAILGTYKDEKEAVKALKSIYRQLKYSKIATL